MHVVVVANGELPEQAGPLLVNLFKRADHVIAADGGLNHCATVGLWPRAVVGDLDSVKAPVLEAARGAGVEVIEHPVDKDMTDLELAMTEAIRWGATELSIATPFGGRLDHELATIGLLSSTRWAPTALSALDGRRTLWVVRDQVELQLAEKTAVSLVPWGSDAHGVTTSGLQWPLTDATLALGTTQGVSNVVIAADQVVSVASGTLLVVQDC